MPTTRKPSNKQHLKLIRKPKYESSCGISSVDIFADKKKHTLWTGKRKYKCMEGRDMDIKGFCLERLTDEEIDNFSTKFWDGYVGYLITGKKVFYEESREPGDPNNPKLTQLPQLSDEELNNIEVLDTLTFECRTFHMYLKAGSKLFYEGQLVEGVDVESISAKDWKAQNYAPEDKNDEYPLHFLDIKGFHMTDEYFILGDQVIYQNKVVVGINATDFRKAIGYVYNHDLYVKVGDIVIKDGEIVTNLLSYMPVT